MDAVPAAGRSKGAGTRSLEGDAGPPTRQARERFSRFARATAEAAGSAWAFGVAALYVLAWLLGGALLGFPDSWQLWLNTVATFVTFLMVFLIQNAHNRHTQVVQIKLDELLASHENASNLLIDLEDLTEDQIDALRGRYQALADECARRRHRGVVSLDTPGPAPTRRVEPSRGGGGESGL